MSTMKDVSRKAGVSSATVSHVINGTRYVSEDVKNRVWEAIRELDYKPNYIARTLRVGQSNTIGLIVPNTRNPYFTEVAWEFEQVAYEQNYSVIICNTENNPEKELFYIRVLMQKQVDGIIFITCGDYKESTDALAQGNTPYVVLDREVDPFANRCAVVMTDEKRGAEMATEHLVELGHTRVACITGGRQQQVTSDKRLAGFWAVMDRHGIPVDDAMIVHGDFLMQSGYDQGMRLLKAIHPPTAIFAFNDLMALGVLRAAAECGFSVPSDLSVVGFDDIEQVAYSIPALTTVSQSKSEIANKGFSQLMKIIKSKKKTGGATVELMPRLVVRGSTAVPKG